MKNRNVIVLISVLIALFLISCTIFIKEKFVDTNAEEEVVTENISFICNRTDKKLELEKLVNEFETSHPNINVNLEIIGDTDEILQRKTAVGDLSDITIVPAYMDNSEFKKYFLPINDLGFSEENINNYNLGVGDNENLYSVAPSMICLGVIYNKDIFKKAGIERLPRSEEEFFEICKVIKEKGFIPVAINYKEPWWMEMWYNAIPNLLDAKFEVNTIANNIDILGEKSCLTESLGFLRSIVKRGFCEDDLLSYEWQQCKDDIKDGKAAMTICNSDLINQLSDMGADKSSFGIFPIPNSKVINMYQDLALAISKNTKYPKSAKEFFKFLFEDDRYAKAVNITSNRKNSEGSKEIIEQIEEFNIPIKYDSRDNQELTDEEKEKKYIFHRKKTKLALDFRFIQKYVISDDVDELKESMDEKWNREK